MSKEHKALFQVAAIPFKCEPDCLKVLLLTTRKTGKWIVPKGWPIEGLNFSQSAEQEALEEAGVKGLISKEPIGDFIYYKKIAPRRRVPCTVVTYGLHVTDQLSEWVEKGQREILWCSLLKAAKKVKNPGLRDIFQSISTDQSILIKNATAID
tara:strand:+ start:616 stop:1074 length:459 start_codon:yes stop_codon:yes gene_type:complete